MDVGILLWEKYPDHFAVDPKKETHTGRSDVWTVTERKGSLTFAEKWQGGLAQRNRGMGICMGNPWAAV